MDLELKAYACALTTFLAAGDLVPWSIGSAPLLQSESSQHIDP